jgi:hypothetical protein
VPRRGPHTPADGEDRITPGEVRNEDGSVMTVAEGLRMPASLASRADNVGETRTVSPA